MTRSLSADELHALSVRTVGHYERSARTFEKGTRDHDVSQNTSALLAAIEEAPPFVLLDFGCGPGRDLAFFRSQGHRPVGLDACPSFVEMARAATGCEVLQQNFLELSLPDGHFHGVFANASLFHVPAQELPRVLGQLHACLRPRGVLFSSNPRGEDSEGFHGERYGSHHSRERWHTLVTSAGFSEIAHYYRPDGKPRAEQPWLATVWRK